MSTEEINKNFGREIEEFIESYKVSERLDKPVNYES